MEEKKLLIFNKPHNVLGSIDTDLILQTKGNIKIRWHNRKFIDLIKNGKLNIEGSQILNKVASLDDIKDDGIYLVEDTGEVILSIDGLTINLSQLGDSSYISFLVPQDLTSELKYQALTNIGFYYETLEDAKAANILNGLVYIVDELKLYLAENGELTEFFVQSPPSEPGENIQNFDELWIGELLHLYNNNDNSIIDAINKLILSVGGDEYITLGDNTVLVSKDMIVNNIQSEGANGSKGFRLYYENGKSVLEVDDIIWRNKPEDEEALKNSRILDESITFSEHDNIIVGAEFAEFTDDGDIVTPIGNKVICKLKYNHKYEKDLYIYIYKQNEETPYVIKCDWGSENTEMSVTINSPYPEDIELEVTFEDESTQTVIIPANQTEVLIPNDKYVESWKVVKGPTTWTDGNTVTSLITDKASPKEYKILETTPDSFTIEVPPNELENFVKSAFNSIVAVSLKPYIRIKDNNLTLLDRSVTKEDKPDETVHSQIGIIKDIDFKFDFNFDFNFDFPKDITTIVSDCPEEDLITWEPETPEPVEPEDPEKPKEEEIQVGIYSDNLRAVKAKLLESELLKSKLLEAQILKGQLLSPQILTGEIVNSTSINTKQYTPITYSPLIYNAVFKLGCKYPSYEEGYEIPEDSNDYTIVDSKWVKAWIDKLLEQIEGVSNSNEELNNEILNNIDNLNAKLDEILNLIKNGTADNPIVLVSGFLNRGSSPNYSFEGNKNAAIDSITAKVLKGAEGDSVLQLDISSSKTVNITSTVAIQAGSDDVPCTDTDYSGEGRLAGAHWLAAYHSGSQVYIREFHKNNHQNDGWITGNWYKFGDHNELGTINKVGITIFGYIT